jgi:putative transcription antitermination factor YqgF
MKKNILAIDFGMKNIGIAFFAKETVVEPITTILVKDKHDAISKLKQYISKLKPDLIVVGIPDYGIIVNEVHEFVNLLEQSTGIKTITHTESYTSKIAIQELRNIKSSKSKLKNDHMYSAALILEDYIETMDKQS